MDNRRTLTKLEIAVNVTKLFPFVSQPQALAIVDQTLNEIRLALQAGGRVELRNFGVFETVQRNARRAMNPKTLERVDVPPRLAVRFRPGRLLRLWETK